MILINVAGTAFVNAQPTDAIHPPSGSDLAALTSSAKDGQTIILEAGEYLGPVVCRNITLNIKGDPNGGSIILGDDRPRTVVVQVANGGNLTLSDVQLKFGIGDQLGIYVSGAAATIQRCSFLNPPSYGCYVQANGQLNINDCRFENFKQPAIAISGSSLVAINKSSFTECDNSAIQIQDGGTLVVDSCQFQTLATSAVVGTNADAIEVRNCRLNQINATAIQVTDNTSVVVTSNDFGDCKRAITAVKSKARLVISDNTIHHVPEQGSGIYVEGGTAGSITNNKIIGASTGITVFHESNEPVSLTGNLILNMSDTGIYIEAQPTNDQLTAQLSDNIVINCAKVSIALNSSARATLASNIVLSNMGIGVSVQQQSSAALSGNVIVGSEASLNIFESSQQDVSLSNELLLGSINTSTDSEPSKLEATQRLDALLSLTETGYSLRNNIKQIIKASSTATPDTFEQFVTTIVEFRQSVADARLEAQQLAAVRLSIEDSIGHSVNASFDLYDGTSPTVGSMKFWAGDIKDAPSLVKHLQVGDSQLAQHLLATADESVRSQIINANASLPIANNLKRAIARELNRLIDGQLLDDNNRSEELTTDPQTDNLRQRVADLSADELKSEENQRLLREVNRQLIEKVFPYQMARSRSLMAIDSSYAWAYAPAGKYWLVPGSNPSQRQLVTLSSGQRNDHLTAVNDSLWIQFRPMQDSATSWFLFALRPKPEMKKALSWLRRPSETWDAFALLRENVKEADLAEARRLALDALAQIAQAEIVDFSLKSVLEDYIMRILVVAGQAEDAQLIIKAFKDSQLGPGRMNLWAAVIANIEARLDLLESGSLVALLRGNPSWALAAAVQLHQYGLDIGDDILREHLGMASHESWITTPAFTLLDSDNSKSLQAMRALLKRIVSEAGDKWNNDYQRAAIPPVLYLITYGNSEDLKLVSRVKMDNELFGYLSFISEDPISMALQLIPYSQGLNSSLALYIGEGFLDRSSDEVPILYARLIRAIASHRARIVRNSDPFRGNPFANSMNTSNIACSYFMPNRTAVRFYGGFGNTTPFEPEIDSRAGLPNLFGDTPWFAEPRLLDRYINWWYEGNRAFEHQLDYVDNVAIAKAVDEKGKTNKPLAYDLFMTAHRISTRAYAHPHDSYPMGLDRRPYVLRHHGETNGGISGVAEMKYDWKGNVLQVQLRLRQQAMYHASSFIDRTSNENYEHYRYMINDGRALIDSIVLRRADKTVAASNTERVEGGFMIFEFTMDQPNPAGWYLDVNMNFLGQRFTLTYSLFASESARRLRWASSIGH